MDVLVTGATGYLGGHVVRRLLDGGHSVRALVREGRDVGWLAEAGAACHVGDLLDERSLHRAARGAEGLVHCAARMGYWSRQDAQQRRINVDGTAALYRVAHRRRIPRIVHVSTVAAVGFTRDGTPLDESAPWAGRHRPHAMYIHSKREAEERALAAAKGGLPIVVVNPGVMIGPRADGRPAGGIVARAASGVRAVPRGGSVVASVEDVADGCSLALAHGRTAERYILGGHNRSWLELYTAIAQAAGVAPPQHERSDLLGRALAAGARGLDLLRLSRPPWAPELFRFWGWYTCADSSKATRELGYTARPLAETIARAVAASRPSAPVRRRRRP